MNDKKIEEIFPDKSEKLIGTGAQAKVYLYNGCAYKVYRPDYPAEWVEFEIKQHTEIYKTGLSKVNFYKTENPGVVRMDFIDGIELEEKIKRDNYTKGFADLAECFRRVHSVSTENVDIPQVKPFYSQLIKNLDVPGITVEQKNFALSVLDGIPDDNRILHLDLHFKNIMCPENAESVKDFIIIDWMNARIGNPVLDYARTYVIFHEFAPKVTKLYFAFIKKDIKRKGYTKKEFLQVVKLMALIRLFEYDSPQTRSLVGN